MNKALTILISLLLILYNNTTKAQDNLEGFSILPKQSTKIFEESDDTIADYRAFQDKHKYYLKLTPSLRFIFGKDGSVVTEDISPGDYTLRLPVGFYKYSDDDTLEISVDSLGSIGFNIDVIFIDKIVEKQNTSSELNFKVFDFNNKEMEKIISVRYKTRPFSLSKSKTLTTLHDNLNELVGKKIFLEIITVARNDSKGSNIYYVPINQKMELEAKTYQIFFRKKWAIIKKIKEKLILFHWDFILQDFKKKDQLIYF